MFDNRTDIPQGLEEFRGSADARKCKDPLAGDAFCIIHVRHESCPEDGFALPVCVTGESITGRSFTDHKNRVHKRPLCRERSPERASRDAQAIADSGAAVVPAAEFDKALALLKEIVGIK